MKSLVKGILLAIATVGVVAFLVSVLVLSPLRAWEAFLVDFLFWVGIAQGGIVVSAALYLSQARWGGAYLYRLAEAGSGFLPLSFALFWVLFPGRYWIFPWLRTPVPAKEPYLNVPFLFSRDGAGLLCMWVLSWTFVHFSRRADAVEWANDHDSLEEAPRPVKRLATILLISYALIYSVLAIDLVMSLSPQWYSTMFALYFSFGAVVSALAAMALVAGCGKERLQHGVPGERRGILHDLGKLLFGATTFWTYLLFSMYLVIWYGDIPKTTFFAAVRVNYAPWGAIGWSALGLVWVFPFIALMGKKPKQTPAIMGAVGFACLVGFWIERYVLVVPSLSPRSIPFGWIEIAITFGFAGLFGLTCLPGLKRIPVAL